MVSKSGIDMTGRVFSITGGASGIGLATAQLLARNGAAAIWIADVQSELFDKVRKKLNDINQNTKIYLDKVDVGNSAEVDQWVQRIVAESGGLHGAANVAGVAATYRHTDGEQPSTLEMDDDEWRRVFRVNADGVMYCTRAQVRAMVKMDKGSNPAIVNVSSLAATKASATLLAYAASKAACAHFTQCVAKDLAGRGLRINSVLPGGVWTPMVMKAIGISPDSADDADPVEVAAQAQNAGCILPEEAAEAIVWLLSENCLQLNGIAVPIGEMDVSR
ncbi:hypothetical protein MCOR27_011480 [Pyricularia oryzae]|nr:hypothetical protein MCOR01_006662 [Pyricularia oryzae]KAI6253328.1 hypothetical protein MCOR19_010104 [Pyricularia oryzae]KAI6265230.1 hypothetical protein MCOR27_011480 [Pyricularia oryzae]KAI6265290.1 hypothetical protein MCOR26_010814 [Pyricularia oryzae]KAI6311521.1 hypothetical protein MCOR30_010823 [Pyricularia oryzae]